MKRKEEKETEEQKIDKELTKEERLKSLRKTLARGATGITAYDLSKHNPAQVTRWISTGSRWLDLIVANKTSLNGGKLGGIPVGRIVELAGLESSGKSYMAMQIAVNAQKMGIDVVYFDSESALDATFAAKMGADLESILYFRAGTVENVCETIEKLLKENPNPMIFIWDSFANTPSNKENEGDFNPQSNIAIKARVIGLCMEKLIDPVNIHGSTFLVLNQLKTNIDPSNPMIHLTEPWTTSGGKALGYAYSLRLWLTGRKASKWFVEDPETNEKIGSDVKVVIKKSRFGTLGRECNFKILWSGPSVSIQDEESWFDAIKKSDQLDTGVWNVLHYEDGTEEKFHAGDWMEKLKDEKFRSRVLQIMEDLLVR